MEPAAKLTKRQKKLLVFRQRKHKKGGPPSSGEVDDLGNAIPVSEDQEDVEDVEVLELGGVKGKDAMGAAEEPRNKRKRDQEDHDDARVGTTKRKKSSASKICIENLGSDNPTIEQPSTLKTDVKQQRFILFIGNLKYTTTCEAIQNHFISCDPPPSVRLMTPKPADNTKTAAKSRGFAFLEFTNKAALQHGLRLHHSQLDGRKINVELTAGGGGKSEKRLCKVKSKNKELHGQRVKRLQRPSGTTAANGDGEDAPDQSHRYSTTSGLEQLSRKKRTWTVGKTVEENVKRKRKNKKPLRPQGTGVNAIPVGE